MDIRKKLKRTTKMKGILISPEDLLDMNVKLAKDLLIEANTSPYKDKKLKSLVLASQVIERCLISENINIEKLKIKKKEKNKNS